jgi:hypothetical protein
METTNHHNENWPDKEQPWQAQSLENKLQDRIDDEKKYGDDEEETPDNDWGTVDPQEHPGRSSGMDPSGPGSAV